MHSTGPVSGHRQLMTAVAGVFAGGPSTIYIVGDPYDVEFNARRRKENAIRILNRALARGELLVKR